jgi:repressor LexA
MNIGERLSHLKTENGLTTDMLAALSGVPKGTINKILNGETRNPTARTLRELARALGCPADVFYADASALPARSTSLPDYKNILPVSRHRVPILGTIAAGVPIFADEEHELFTASGENIRCDFALRVKGASMIGARIRDGDIVFIRRQDNVDDGQIAAVVIGDEATLKRVYHVRDGVTLVAENPDFPPMVFTGEDCQLIRILGRAVGFQSSL